MKNPYYHGPISNHFDGVRFFNPGQASTDRTMSEVLRWKSKGAAKAWPKEVPVRPVLPNAQSVDLTITMVGHATLLIQVEGLNLLTDPVWSERVSPVTFAGPRRVTLPGIAFDELPKIDAVLISHCHYDHLDTVTLGRLCVRDDPLILAPLGNDGIVRAKVPSARIVTGDWYDRFNLANGLSVTLTPAIHWSNRWLHDRRMSLWAGHAIHSPQGDVWFAGDTAYGDGNIFKEIRDRLGTPRVALIPIGAYAPRWFMRAQHVDPPEAVKIFQDLGAERAIGIHWGTFQLTDEGIDTPMLDLANALESAAIDPDRFVAARPADVFRYPTAN